MGFEIPRGDDGRFDLSALFSTPLDQIAGGFAGLTFSLEELADLETQAVEAFDTLRDDPALTGEGLAQLRALATFVIEVRGRITAGEAAADQVEQDIAALAAAVHPTEHQHPEGDAPAEGTEPGEGEGGGDAPVEPAAVVPAPVLAGGVIRAAGRRTTGSRGPRSQSIAVDPQMHHRITAAPDLPRRARGASSEITNVGDLAAAFDSRVSAFPRHVSGSRMAVAQTRMKHAVATIEKAESATGPLLADGEDFWDRLDELADEKRLTGGNLIAAGGWCAPNVRVWELCPGLETLAGLADFPSFRLERGGIEYPVALDFRDIYSNANLDFHQTEADSISGTDKVCYAIPCPTFASARLEIDGICFSHDIVQNSVWPELTRDVMRRALTAHEHKINARLLTQIFTIAATGSTAFVLPLGADVDGDQTTTAVMGAMVLGAVDYRYRYRMDPSATIEAIAPIWLREWIRTDMSRRAGLPYMAVTDAQIDSFFAARNIRVQWVYDLQDGYVGANTLFGGTGVPAAAQWPSSVQVAMFAPGTFAKGGNGIIDLSAVYDSTGLKDNAYTAAFTEESVLLLKRCYASYRLTIPLCPTGQTSQLGSFDCSVA